MYTQLSLLRILNHKGALDIRLVDTGYPAGRIIRLVHTGYPSGRIIRIVYAGYPAGRIIRLVYTGYPSGRKTYRIGSRRLYLNFTQSPSPNEKKLLLLC